MASRLKWKCEENDGIKFSPTKNDCLNAIRTLHQTVVCLRTVLERSQGELFLLKTELSKLGNEKCNDISNQLSSEKRELEPNTLTAIPKHLNNILMDNVNQESRDSEVEENENEEINETEETKIEQFNLYKSKTDSEDSEEVDDIELIFTTEDTKGISLQEELESISDDGEGFELKTEINRRGIATQSVLVETDISKCGVVYDDEDAPSSVKVFPSDTFRDALKIEHAIEKKTSNFTHAPVKTIIHIARPILNENAASVRDSEAQTDISAVPLHWKSESFLVNNKASHNFPTLPSKFNIPVKDPVQKAPLRLTEKTQKARRILLSDINFTSMVPELSRSVDHLCQNGVRLPNTGIQTSFAMKYLKSPALASSGSSYSRFEFNVGNSSWNWYDNSFASDYDRSVQDLQAKRRQSWRPSIYSLDAYCGNRTSSVPPSPTLRRHSAALSYSPSGNADTQFYYPLPDKFNVKTFSNSTLKNTSMNSLHRKLKSKVCFKDPYLFKNTDSRRSLPNILVDAESEEESTDSLIDESEEYIRKSIDSTTTHTDWPHLQYRYCNRTHSVPNLFSEIVPPFSARPFIARSANDLKTNYFVKVINKEGHVVGGRVQFVGSIPGKSEPFVGILLPPNKGETDGVFQGLRYFTCEKNCGLFVPFRKVVMAWKV